MTNNRRDFLKLTGAAGIAGATIGASTPAEAAAPKTLADRFPSWTDEPYVHWSAHVSLYSAKTRAYMNKKGLHFVEKTPGSDDRWKNVIEPAMGYLGIPVLDLPDGTFISDTTAPILFQVDVQDGYVGCAYAGDSSGLTEVGRADFVQALPAFGGESGYGVVIEILR